VPTYNSASTLQATLESVKWVDEIVVVDSFSSDQTLDIAHEFGAIVISHEYINSATQKNWAISYCTSAWVFQVDSDEVITPELKEEILQVLGSPTEGVDAYRMPRRNLFLGEWLKYGGNYPDYQTRLYRRTLGKWQDREVHAHVLVPGMIETLSACIIHDDWTTLAKMLGRLDRYTRYEADELKKHGASFRARDLVIRPAVGFVYRYFWKQAFRDGWRGFIFAVYVGVYVFMTRAKLWEMDILRVNQSPKR
jgi:glycosyltransferase involved in cell wall biosynthesis